MAPSTIDEFLGARPASKWRRGLQWLSAALAAATVVVLVGRFVSGGEVTRYATETVRRADLQTAATGVGTLQLTQGRTVTAGGAQGRLLAVLVREGQGVRRGQPLARLDPAAALAQVAEAETLIDVRETALARAAATEREARERLQRFETVRRESDNRAPSDREMDVARDAARRAAAAVEAATVELRAARATLADRLGAVAAADIPAPAEGVVTRILAAPGQALTGDQPLLEIAPPPSRLMVEVLVERGAAEGLRPGDVGQVTAGGGRAHAARVAGVRASRAADAGRAVVTLDIDNPHGALRVGERVTARISRTTRRNALVVPVGALQFARASDAGRGGGATGDAIYVLGDQGAPRRVPVTLAGSDGAHQAVASPSLEPGMAVIVGLR